jgi:hypothetical protein
MEDRITEGDEVFVAFADGDSLDGKVIYMPLQPDEFWIIEGVYNLFYINSTSGAVKYIAKAK